jgi:hypothetical protein
LVLLDSKSPLHILVVIAANKQRVARPWRQITPFRLLLIGAAIVTPYALLADLDHNTEPSTDHALLPSSFAGTFHNYSRQLHKSSIFSAAVGNYARTVTTIK